MFQVPSQKTIDDYLINQLGLTKEDRYFYGNEYLAITDVSNVSDNVLCDEDGKLYFIDPIIRLKKSEKQWLDAVEQIRRYADAPRVEALRQGSTLHKIIMQFKGWELARIEEIE